MERSLLLCSLSFALNAQAQYGQQSFDSVPGDNIVVHLDTTAGNLWQVGPPQKTLFVEAYSDPNVIVTDTVNGYPANNTSSFLIKLPLQEFGWFPDYFLYFEQAFDTDTLHDGGYIELSYDSGATWMNIFEDWVSIPNVAIYDGQGYPVEPDTLFNGQLGFSGNSCTDTTGYHEWVWTSFCWTPTGVPLPDSLYVRFTFVSDSIAETVARDGWMIDQINWEAYIAHPVMDYLKKDDFFSVAPNPMSDRLFLVYDVDDVAVEVSIALFDLEGRLLQTLVSGQQAPGVHHVICWRDQLPASAQMVVLRADIGDRHETRNVVLAPSGK